MDYGIKIEHVNKAHLQSVLQELGDPAAAEKGIDQLILAAVARFGEEKDVARCDRCLGRSPSNLPSCAFCGDVSEVQDDAKPTDVESSAGRPARRTKVKSGAKANGANGAPETATPAAAETGTTATTAIVVHEEETRTLATVADLDREVARYRELKADAATSLWRVGAQIALLRDTELWRQRKKKNGDDKYENWDQFCKEELGMTHGNAFNLIDVSKEYTEKDVAELGGTTNCALLLTAPNEDRARLEEEVREEVRSGGKGASVRGVRAKVRGAREKAGKLGHKRDTGRARVGSAVTRVPDRISIVSARTISGDLYTKETVKGDEPKIAKSFTEEPTAIVELTNHVKAHISFFKKDGGGFAYKIRFKRDE